MGGKAKTAEKQLKLEMVKPNLLLYPNLASTLPNLLNGIDSWLEQLNVMATLRASRRSGHSELKRCIHLTDPIADFVTWMVAKCWINWHLTVAKCAVPSGLSPRLCCNKRAVRVCVAGCFNCNKGNPSLVAVTLHSHITVSPVTCHLSVKHWARELVWPSRDRRGYTSYWRTIPCCTCILAEYGSPSLKLDSIHLVQRYPISWSFMIPFLWNTKYIWISLNHI